MSGHAVAAGHGAICHQHDTAFDVVKGLFVGIVNRSIYDCKKQVNKSFP